MKRYAIKSREFGRSKPRTHRFATLREASAFVQDYWQGIEYMDSFDSFHTDFSTFTLEGFNLNDIGTVHIDDPNDWYSRSFVFNDPVPLGSDD